MQEIKIFVISLKDSKDRRKKIFSRMKQLELEFDFFDGLDGRGGLPKKYINRINYKKINKRLGRNITNGELACALSHSLLYEKIVNENIQQAVILEDDAIITDDFAKLIKQNCFQITKFDMIMLYHHMARVIENKLINFVNGYKIGNVINQPTGAVGYYINKDMAKKLYQATKIISYVSDWNINTRVKNIGVIVPRVIRHPKLLNSILDNAREIEIEKNSRKLFYKSKSLDYIREFGLLKFLQYKLQEKKSICVSKKVDGK